MERTECLDAAAIIEAIDADLEIGATNLTPRILYDARLIAQPLARMSIYDAGESSTVTKGGCETLPYSTYWLKS